MKHEQFVANAADRLETLWVDGRRDHRRGRHYDAGPLLVHAVNTALALGRPLLLSGEPGCGKTSLGFAIARRLGIERVHFYAVKSDAEPRSLFYEYDAMRHFHAVRARGDAHEGAGDPRDYLRYRALGQAILDALPVNPHIAELLPRGAEPPPEPTRSVVIIDEIDKAPRDFPNDLLNEIDQLWFRIPELTGVVDHPETPRDAIPAARRPILVITSNLERQLPDAFLRRCVFHHIAYPTRQRLKLILDRHLEDESFKLPDTDIRSALELVEWARRQSLDKPPGLSELLEFVRALGRRQDQLDANQFSGRAEAALSALVKTTRDLATLRQHLAS